jgi:PAS domain S-box-containing protein
MFRQTSIKRMSFSGFLVIISVLTASLGSFFIYEEYQHVNAESVALEEEYLRLTKDMMRKEVEMIIESINFERKQTETRIRNTLRDRVIQAILIAKEIYRKNQGHLSDEAIKRIIIDRLRGVRFDSGRGYYFATVGADKEMIADKPELAGRTLTNVSDTSAEGAVRNMVAMVTGTEEGFYRYWAPKPNDPGSESPKLSFVKYFGLVGWYIGTGVYLDDMRRDVQKQILERMFSRPYKPGRYLYVFQYDGTVLYHVQKQYIGRNMLWSIDSNGAEVVRQLLDVSRKPGGGYVASIGEKPQTGQPIPRIAYAGAYKDWGWVIVMDRDIDDLEAILQQNKAALQRDVKGHVIKIIFVFLAFFALAILLSRYFSGKLDKEFGVFSDFFQKAAATYKGIDKNRLNILEFRDLADSANQMIQDRRNAEEALQESEAQVRLLLSSTAEAIIGLDTRGNCTFANPSGLKLLGYKHAEDELIGKNMHVLMHHSRHDGSPYPEEECRICLAFREGVGTHTDEEVLWRSDGTSFPAEIWSYPIYRDNQIVGWVLTFVDITERTQVEQALQRAHDELETRVAERTAELAVAKEQAESANQAKSDFLARMSHELRTPLNAILGYAQILKRQGDLTEKQKEQISTIQSSGEHLLSLISDILDLARIEAQKEKVELMEFNLSTLIHEVLNTIRVKAAEKDLAFHYEERSSIPALVRGDARKIRQVLLNLLGNAVKYTEHGSITLRVGTRDQGSGIRELEESQVPIYQDQTADPRPPIPETGLFFEIEDSGIGIPEDKHEAIFEHFTQMEGEGRTTEGTGLGLSISRKLIELMGGKLTCDSEVGKGSTFTVELVIEVLESVEAEAIEPEKVIVGYEGERKRILIVDDNITNLAMLVSLLEPLGFDIYTAENGEEAVENAVAVDPDLILMDLLMPVMDGDKALQQIKDDNELKSIKVIAVSAAVADRERADAFAADCDDFISKPVDTTLLLDKLKAQLEIEWIEDEDGGRKTKDERRGTTDEEVRPVKMPPRPVLERIIQHAERGEFTKLGRILDELEAEDAGYSSFCDRVKEYARKYDDEGIVEYIKSRGDK